MFSLPPICGNMADCKPIVFMSVMLLSFWLMLSYLTNSYFVIFLIVSNFILLFACCVSLSGYVIGKYIDTRQEPPSIVEERRNAEELFGDLAHPSDIFTTLPDLHEAQPHSEGSYYRHGMKVPTISGTQPFVIPEYPPSYEEATKPNRPNWQQPRSINRQRRSTGSVVICIPLETEQGRQYLNVQPSSTSAEATTSSAVSSGNASSQFQRQAPSSSSSSGSTTIYSNPIAIPHNRLTVTTPSPTFRARRSSIGSIASIGTVSTSSLPSTSLSTTPSHSYASSGMTASSSSSSSYKSTFERRKSLPIMKEKKGQTGISQTTTSAQEVT